MVELDFTQEIGREPIEIERTDVMTGDRNQSRFLYYQLVRSIKQASQIDIIVSFLMESGVRMLLKELNSALNRGARVRILTGNYLGITQPSALYLIKHELKDRIDLRFYNERERSFHPKSYIFHYSNYSEIYIGSSNISRSALTSGIEWNYRFSSNTDRENYEKFFRTFEDLFENHSIRIDDEKLREYSKNWHRPAAAKDLDRYDESEADTDVKVVPMADDIVNIFTLLLNDAFMEYENLNPVVKTEKMAVATSILLDASLREVLGNMSGTIKYSHYPELCLSWLTVCDDYQFNVMEN